MTALHVPAHHEPDGPETVAAVAGTAAPGPRDPDDSRLQIEVRPVDAARGVIITMTGAVAPRDVAALERSLAAELDRVPHVIVLDLSAVPTCDPAGVDVLVRARDRARHENVAVHLVHLGAPAARRWLTVAGLT